MEQPTVDAHVWENVGDGLVPPRTTFTQPTPQREPGDHKGRPYGHS